MDHAWPYGEVPPREHTAKAGAPPRGPAVVVSVRTRSFFLRVPPFFVFSLRARLASIVLPLVALIVPFLLQPEYSPPSPPSPNSTSRTSRLSTSSARCPDYPFPEISAASPQAAAYHLLRSRPPTFTLTLALGFTLDLALTLHN